MRNQKSLVNLQFSLSTDHSFNRVVSIEYHDLNEILNSENKLIQYPSAVDSQNKTWVFRHIGYSSVSYEGKDHYINNFVFVKELDVTCSGYYSKDLVI